MSLVLFFFSNWNLSFFNKRVKNHPTLAISRIPVTVGVLGRNKEPQLVKAGNKYQIALAASTLIILFPENVQILNQKTFTEQSFVKQNEEFLAYSKIFYFFKD
jgi:hypothetical protein